MAHQNNTTYWDREKDVVVKQKSPPHKKWLKQKANNMEITK